MMVYDSRKPFFTIKELINQKDDIEISGLLKKVKEYLDQWITDCDTEPIAIGIIQLILGEIRKGTSS